MALTMLPQLIDNDAVRALRAAITQPDRFAVEGKVDGVRGLVIFAPNGLVTRNRRGERRAWRHGQPRERTLRRLARRLPIPDRWERRGRGGWLMQAVSVRESDRPEEIAGSEA